MTNDKTAIVIRIGLVPICEFWLERMTIEEAVQDNFDCRHGMHDYGHHIAQVVDGYLATSDPDSPDEALEDLSLKIKALIEEHFR